MWSLDKFRITVLEFRVLRGESQLNSPFRGDLATKKSNAISPEQLLWCHDAKISRLCLAWSFSLIRKVIENPGSCEKRYVNFRVC